MSTETEPIATRGVTRRRLVVGALWVPPAVAVVSMTTATAAHASGTTCTTTFPSHGFVVLNVPAPGSSTPTYYAFKFGDGTSATPVPGAVNEPKDRAYLEATPPYAGATIIDRPNEGTAAQRATWEQLRQNITVATYSDSTGSGYVLTNAPTSLVGAYAYDGSFKDNAFRVHTVSGSGGQFRFGKCG